MKFKYGQLLEVTDTKSFYNGVMGYAEDFKTEESYSKSKKVLREKYFVSVNTSQGWKQFWFYDDQLQLVTQDMLRERAKAQPK
ncbi:MAG: hypothetical protein Q8O88_00915 [bacterium]|nr:hypothetical protein [bacterium]